MPEPCGGNLLNASLEVKAKLACLYAGAVWGLFWIPLRALEEAGIHGLWITVVYFAATPLTAAITGFGSLRMATMMGL